MIELGVNIDHVATHPPGASHVRNRIQSGPPWRLIWVVPMALRCICAKTVGTFGDADVRRLRRDDADQAESGDGGN